MKSREQFSPKYGRVFDDESVVNAYATRPPYPLEVVDILLDLVSTDPRVVLDARCGPGTCPGGVKVPRMGKHRYRRSTEQGITEAGAR